MFEALIRLTAAAHAETNIYIYIYVPLSEVFSRSNLMEQEFTCSLGKLKTETRLKTGRSLLDYRIPAIIELPASFS